MGMKAYVEAPSDASARATRLELFVPRNARVWIKSGSADIDVQVFVARSTSTSSVDS